MNLMNDYFQEYSKYNKTPAAPAWRALKKNECTDKLTAHTHTHTRMFVHIYRQIFSLAFANTYLCIRKHGARPQTRQTAKVQVLNSSTQNLKTMQAAVCVCVCVRLSYVIDYMSWAQTQMYAEKWRSSKCTGLTPFRVLKWVFTSASHEELDHISTSVKQTDVQRVSHLLLIHSLSSVVQELTCWSLSVSNIRLPRLTCRDKDAFRCTVTPHVEATLCRCEKGPLLYCFSHADWAHSGSGPPLL